MLMSLQQFQGPDLPKNTHFRIYLFGCGVSFVVQRFVALDELSREKRTLDKRTQRMALIWKANKNVLNHARNITAIF